MNITMDIIQEFPKGTVFKLQRGQDDSVDFDVINSYFGQEDMTILCRDISISTKSLVPLKTSMTLLSLYSPVFRRLIQETVELTNCERSDIAFLMPGFNFQVMDHVLCFIEIRIYP